MSAARMSSFLFFLGWALAVWVEPARGQLSFGPGPFVIVDDPFGVFSPIDPLDATATIAGFALDGDFVLNLNNAPTEDVVTFEVKAFRFFDVGGLPVSASTSVFEHYKVVVGGGAENDPAVTLLTSLQVQHVPLMGPFPVVHPLTASPPTVEQMGNGFTVVGDVVPGQTDDFVLAQGPYVLEYRMLGVIENGHHLPEPTITVEMGGISGFEGVQALIAAVTVPEPGTLTLLALGGLLAIGVVVRLRRQAAV